MKKNINTPYWWLIPTGLLINSGTLFIHHFHPLPDSLLGILQGIGIALMISALLKQKIKPA
ncbi:hypothetical protein [Mucilaginibacter sp. UYCu711]|uniref:hypothetical protein n=1 Tax=Mucilaginibacter sp. UYCu711 TaxID=3156339 RepID=UPI003D1FD2B3